MKITPIENQLMGMTSEDLKNLRDTIECILSTRDYSIAIDALVNIMNNCLIIDSLSTYIPVPGDDYGKWSDFADGLRTLANQLSVTKNNLMSK